MVTRNSVWVSGLGGIGCVALGVAIGSVWPAGQATQVWTEAPAVRQAAVLPSFAEVVQRVGPGVVTVRALCSDDVPPLVGTAPDQGDLRRVHASRAGLRSGSGFVVSARGLVVTSRHVIVGAIDVDVIVPGHEPCRAEIVGEDVATDLALLRLPSAPADLTALPLATDNDVQAGDWIVALGNPFGYTQTVTAGIVSFIGRHLRHSDFGVTNDFLQISAPVNPGSSGCPIVDLQGRVVGVTTQAPLDAQGISFAVPSRTVKWTLARMQSSPDGRVRRGYLGIEFASRAGVDGRGQRQAGAVVMQVVEGEPAHRAGLRAGDVVVRVDGQVVPDARALHERIVSAEPGATVALQVLRDGRDGAEDSLVAVLGEIGSRHRDQPN